MKRFFAFVENAITKTNDVVGKASSFLVYFVIFILVFEVFMRYVFMLPTRYSYELSLLAYMAFFALGAGYAFSNNAHVKVDVFYKRLSRRGKMIVDLISYPVFFFLTAGAFVYQTQRSMFFAFLTGELGVQSPFRYPMWPIRTVMFIGAVLLTLQGIVKFAEIFKRYEKEDSHAEP